MQTLLIAFTVLVGIVNTVQTGTNTTLNKALASPVWAVLAVGTGTFVTALVAALATTAVTGQRPSWDEIASVPWWGWIGGAMGAVYLLSIMLVAEKVGAAVFMAIIVTSAVATSLAMDHFGLLGFAEHKAGIGRFVGAILMIAGVGLIAKF